MQLSWESVAGFPKQTNKVGLEAGEDVAGREEEDGGGSYYGPEAYGQET